MVSKEKKEQEAIEQAAKENNKLSKVLGNVVREQQEQGILKSKLTEQSRSTDYDSAEPSYTVQATVEGGTSGTTEEAAAIKAALDTGEAWKEVRPAEGGVVPTQSVNTAQKEQPTGQSAKPIALAPSVENNTQPGSTPRPLAGGDGSTVQPPPNQIAQPPRSLQQSVEQAQSPTPSAPSAKLAELTPPPLEKTPPSSSSPITGPPPTIAQRVPDAVPGIIGDQPGQSRLTGQVSYGSPQEKVSDNRQAVPVDGSTASKEQIRDRAAQSESARPDSPNQQVGKAGTQRLPDLPFDVPVGQESPSHRALLLISKQQNQQYVEDVEKFGKQEALNRFYEAQKQAADSGKVSSDNSEQRTEKGAVAKAEPQTSKTDSGTKSDSTAENKTTKSEQPPESKSAKPEQSTEGKGAKTDSSSADSKATKPEAGETKGSKSDVPNAEGKTTKPDAGTRPGDHAPSGGKIAETNPEGTRSGDIDKSGKVAETSTGSKTGDVSTHKTPDGKTGDGPTSKGGPEIGFVGKGGEGSGKSFEPGDRSQDGKTASSPDKRGGTDGKSQGGDAFVGDRGGGLGSGWKTSEGSNKGQQSDSKKGEQSPPKNEQGSGYKGSGEQGSAKSPARPEKNEQRPDKEPRADKNEPPRSIKGGVESKGPQTKDGGQPQSGDKRSPNRAPASSDATRPNPLGGGKIADAPPATSTGTPRKDASKPTRIDEKADTKPSPKQGDNPGFVPAIRGGGIPGVSIPEWMVRTDSKKPAKGDKDRDKGKDKDKDKNAPEQSQLTKKIKAVKDEAQETTAKQAPLAEGEPTGEKPRVDLLLPGKTRRDPGALVNDQSKKPSGKDSKPSTDSPSLKEEDPKQPKRPEQTQRTDKEDAMLNQQGRKVPMQLAGRVTEPLPAIGKLSPKPPAEKGQAEKSPAEKSAPEKPVAPAASSLGNRDAVMALLLGKGKGPDTGKGDAEKSADKTVEDKHDAVAKVPAVPPKATISGVLGGPKKLTRRWQATESGTFKLSSSDSIKAINSGDVLPSERLTQQDPPRKPVNWIRDQFAARQEQQSKQRRQYISQQGDHLGLVAVKTIGRTSPEVERLFLRLNPHLEMRRTYSEEHKTDVSFLEPGSIISLPTWDEIQNVP